jgi:hypothetical protein
VLEIGSGFFGGPMAKRRDISLPPSPANCGNTNHIQWLRLRPSSFALNPFEHRVLRLDEALQVERIVLISASHGEALSAATQTMASRCLRCGA